MHITPLLRIDLKRILTEAGFAPPIFRYTNEGGLPGYPTMSWQKFQAGYSPVYASATTYSHSPASLN